MKPRKFTPPPINLAPLSYPPMQQNSGTSFIGAGGFDLMHGAAIKPDIIGKLSTDNKVPPLVPGTGMGMGMSGKP